MCVLFLSVLLSFFLFLSLMYIRYGCVCLKTAIKQSNISVTGSASPCCKPCKPIPVQSERRNSRLMTLCGGRTRGHALTQRAGRAM